MNDFYPTVVYTKFGNMVNDIIHQLHENNIEADSQEETDVYILPRSQYTINDNTQHLLKETRMAKTFIYNPKSFYYGYKHLNDRDVEIVVNQPKKDS